MKYTLHIVSFNVPYPPDYGGIMDVFYRIRTLKQLNVGIILHCFTYGRPCSKELEDLCLEVHYYKRNMNLLLLLKKDPFIVLSRHNEDILIDLCKDNYPILFEGLHCTAFLNEKYLEKRFMMVRTHNIEQDYYRELAKVERNVLKKLFFLSEAKKIERYEPVLKNASVLLTVTPSDNEHFSKFCKSIVVRSFHKSEECSSITGSGKYLLIHGDFTTPENNASVLFLLRNVISKLDYKTVIAGKKPSKEVFKTASSSENVIIIADPSEKEMCELIANAHICLLHTFQPTGLKLKLITSLYMGRHIISSPEITFSTGLDKLCHTANEKEDWYTLVCDLMKKPFSEEEKTYRNSILSKVLDVNTNAELIIEQIKNNVEQRFSA